jgi:choline-glycine betaine transporter
VAVKAKKKQSSTIVASLSALTWRQALTAVSIISVVVSAISPLAETARITFPPFATFLLLLSIVAIKEIERRLAQRVEADSAPADTRYIDDLVDEVQALKRENAELKRTNVLPAPSHNGDTLPAYAVERAKATEDTSDV